MTWACRLIVPEGKIGPDTARAGDMFFYDEKADPKPADYDQDRWHWARVFAASNKLSEYYRAHNSHRLPLLVWLPGLTLFCIDSMCFSGDRGYYGGWTVRGEPPLITVEPSINVGGTYHGFLQNGVIGVDVEGRKFDEIGRRIHP